jgi:hypothetical protein
MTAASKALAKATTLQDVLNVKDVAAAMKTLLAQQGQSQHLQNQAAELKLRAERKAGTLLSEMELKPGVKSISDNVSSIDSLESLGITPKQSSRWQQEATVSEDDFTKMVADVNESGEELTQAKLLKLARGAHVGNNSCDNEWYTPEEYIQPFRDMVGGIDIDPASCEFANRQVKAKRFYSIDEDGLTQQWKGNIWLNPPYGSGAVEPFIDKVIQEMSAGRIKHIAVLVNNATETKWFQRLLVNSQAVCFLASRIKFLKPSAETNSPLQGQVICYGGSKIEEFGKAYESLGITLFTKEAM